MSEERKERTCSRLGEMVEVLDRYLDEDVNVLYQDTNGEIDTSPLAQDWARVAKSAEEVGEVIDAFMGLTGQNPRKGLYGDMDHLLDELADVALTGLYTIQHFTKDKERTLDALFERAHHHLVRVGLENREI